jgi:hypothetical protein
MPLRSSRCCCTSLKTALNKYLTTADAEVKTLADVIAFNKANEGHRDALLQTGRL